MERIILASESPNRRALLAQVGIPFEVRPSGVEETAAAGETIRVRARRLAALKVRAVAEQLQADGRQDEWILGFDTLVEIDGRIIGKPRDRDDARRILTELSGRAHLVTTGLAVLAPAGGFTSPLVRSCTTRVTFRRLTEQDLAFYLDTDEWLGAAGAYRIQGKGALLVRRLEGSYSNVVGLPLSLLYGILRKVGYSFARC